MSGLGQDKGIAPLIGQVFVDVNEELPFDDLSSCPGLVRAKAATPGAMLAAGVGFSFEVRFTAEEVAAYH